MAKVKSGWLKKGRTKNKNPKTNKFGYFYTHIWGNGKKGERSGIMTRSGRNRAFNRMLEDNPKLIDLDKKPK